MYVCMYVWSIELQAMAVVKLPFCSFFTFYQMFYRLVKKKPYVFVFHSVFYKHFWGHFYFIKFNMQCFGQTENAIENSNKNKMNVKLFNGKAKNF